MNKTKTYFLLNMHCIVVIMSIHFALQFSNKHTKMFLGKNKDKTGVKIRAKRLCSVCF